MTEFIVALSAIFIVAGVLLIVANQLDLPPVPMYIIAGLLTGWQISEGELIELALWGIAFLVFVFGIRIDTEDLRSMLRDGEGAAVTQVLIVGPVAFAVGFALFEGLGAGDPIRNAIYFAVAATLSSSLVGLRLLESEIRNNLVHGRLAATVHFFDDIVGIAALLVLSAEVLSDAQLVTSKLGYGVLFIVAGLALYRHGFPLLLRLAGSSDELVLMGSISILIAFMAAAEAVDVSIVVGAFAAGLAIRKEGAQSLSVRNGLDAISDFFSAIFFITVGALVSVPSGSVLLIASVLVLLVFVLNPVVHTLAFLYEGYDGRTGFLSATGLNQVSELSLVIVMQAMLLQTIAPELFEAVILAAAITMILSAFSARYRHSIYDRLFAPIFEQTTMAVLSDRSQVSTALSDHVIVIGYGRQGRRIVHTLEEIAVPYVVIENDPLLEPDLNEDCDNYVFGDAIASSPMTYANVGSARLIVSTVDHEPVSRSLLALDCDADIILRSDSSSVAASLLAAGATYVAVPSVVAADQLVENVKRVLDDETSLDELESDHREYLRMIELAGLERRFERS